MVLIQSCYAPVPREELETILAFLVVVVVVLVAVVLEARLATGVAEKIFPSK
jgi:hypothetical protein